MAKEKETGKKDAGKPAGKDAGKGAAKPGAKAGKAGKAEKAAAPAAAGGKRKPGPPARLHEKYKAEVVPALMKQFGYTNPMEVPKLVKITINMGVGEAATNKKVLKNAVADMTKIVWNDRIDAALCAVFIAVVLSMIWFGIGACLKSYQADGWTAREFNPVAIPAE